MNDCDDFKKIYPKSVKCCDYCHSEQGPTIIVVAGIEYAVCCEKVGYLEKNKILFHLQGKLKGVNKR